MWHKDKAPSLQKQNSNMMGYRLTSTEEPTDEMLHSIMEQVAVSARKSTANANRVLQQKMNDTIEMIRKKRSQLK